MTPLELKDKLNTAIRMWEAYDRMPAFPTNTIGLEELHRQLSNLSFYAWKMMRAVKKQLADIPKPSPYCSCKGPRTIGWRQTGQMYCLGCQSQVKESRAYDSYIQPGFKR